MDDSSLAGTLRMRARAHPGSVALIEPAGRRTWRRVSFGELDRLADRYAAGLARAGVRQGDRALYLLRPSSDGYAVFYALLRLGAIPVFLDPRMAVRRLLACIQAVRPRVVLAVPALQGLRLLAPRAFASAEVVIASGRVRLPGTRLLRRCLGEANGAPHVTVTRDDPCFLPFTSGATGLAKGVLCTHGMVQAQLELMPEVCGWREGTSVVMCYAPFVPYALADGLAAILPDMDFTRPAAARPERIVEAVTMSGAVCAFASPIVWMRLVRHCETHRVALPTLRQAVAAGAPVPIDLHRRLGAILHPDGDLFTPYGATEAMPLTTAAGRALGDTWGQSRRGDGTCVGGPLSGVDLRIIRVTDEPIPIWSDSLRVPDGAVGEIVVGSLVVSPAYPDLPEETLRAKIREDGRVLHRTGDLGRLDARGRLWFCGRKAHRIQTQAGMLAPVPLENIFNQHPGVFRSAVVGVGPRGRQTPVACLELEPGVSFTPRLEAELAGLAEGTCFAGRVTRFLPHAGFPVDPRHNSKIRREELANWAARRLVRPGPGRPVP
jgi:acyl-CoA synthetase (AMP-forming)/AMP-acid ligase II